MTVLYVITDVYVPNSFDDCLTRAYCLVRAELAQWQAAYELVGCAHLSTRLLAVFYVMTVL